MVTKGKVLDLGCGDGFFLNELKKRGIKGTGLDISEVAVKKAQEKGLDVRQADISKRIPYPDNSFENVIMLALLEHLYSPLDVLREARRVSKNYVVICVPNFNSLPARLQMLFGKTPENNKHKMGHLYWFSYSVLKDLIQKADLKIEQLEVHSFFSRRPVLRNIMQFLAEKRPSIFALSFSIKCKKQIK